MDQGKVFISSILNRKTEDLLAEREAVREVVDSYRFLRAWVFEKAPASTEDLDQAYLRHVDECDLFILIVGREVTNPVTAECQRAKEKNKPILVFAKSVQNRTPLSQALLQIAGVKYAPFDSVDSLRQAVQAAIDQELVLALRSSRSRSGVWSILERLRQLAKKRTVVHIRPTFPRKAELDDFQLQEVKQDVAIFQKLSSGHQVNIPTSRVAEILTVSVSGSPVLLLEGRLQWVTPSESWRFFEEKPEPDSVLGFHKPSHLHDPAANTITNQIREKGYEPGWASEVDLPGREGTEFETVYDEDGRYFRIPDPYRSLILIRKRR